MKKIILLILYAGIMFGQDSSNAVHDSLIIHDSLKVKEHSEATKVENNESVKPAVDKSKDSVAAQNAVTPIDTSESVIIKTEKKLDQIIPEIKIPALNIFKDINIFTIIKIFVLILIGAGLSRLIDFISKIKNLKSRFRFFRFMVSTLKILIWILIFYAIFDLIIPNSSEFIFVLVLIVITVASVAVIPLIKNFVGGLYLAVSMPFTVGDFIKIDDYEGEVLKINWKDVVINSDNDNHLSIPCGLFLATPVLNYHRQQKEQLLTLDFEFGFEFEPDKVVKIIYEAALSSPYIYSKVEHKVMLTNNDFIGKKRTFQLQVYIIDVKFTDNLVHSLNMIINRAIMESK